MSVSLYDIIAPRAERGDMIYFNGNYPSLFKYGTPGLFLRTNGQGEVPTWESMSIAGIAAGGDLSGTYPDPSVVWVNGYPTYDARYTPLTRTISTTSPLSGGGNLSVDRTLTTSMSTNKLIGRGTAGAGVMEEITLGTNLSLSGTTLNASGGSVTPAALTKTDDTNVTLTLGGTPTTALLEATSLTLGWTGTLADSRITSATTWNAKQNAITTGTTAQYFRGDLSLATFPSVLSDDTIILAYQALGSSVKAMSVGLSFDRLTNAVTLTDQNELYIAVYLSTAQTITGVKWYQGTQGNYTANNYNGVGLYTYSGGTMTLVASSTDDGAIWKGTSNSIQSKAFSSTYSAVAGIYYVCAMYCRSAVVAAPTIYGPTATATLAAGALDFTNSAKLVSTKASGTSLPATRLQSATTGTNTSPMMALY